MINCESENEASLDDAIQRAVRYLQDADALVVCSGAGMGADSGLPTFRGTAASPWSILDSLNLDYTRICNPKWFKEDPAVAWKFWHHCQESYLKSEPHDGYRILRNWAERMKCGAFCYTTNIDGHWERAKWPVDSIWEYHGSVHRMQCSGPCNTDVWHAKSADGSLPQCQACKSVARPHVVMFYDQCFIKDGVHETQRENYSRFVDKIREKKPSLVVVEVGAGEDVPTVRKETQWLAKDLGARWIRINPAATKASSIKDGVGVSLQLPALEALQRLDSKLTLQSAAHPQKRRRLSGKVSPAQTEETSQATDHAAESLVPAESAGKRMEEPPQSQRAAPLNPAMQPFKATRTRCMARVWGEGWGLRCSAFAAGCAPQDDMCSLHLKGPTHGRFDGDVPEAKKKEMVQTQRKCLKQGKRPPAGQQWTALVEVPAAA
eukprot:TRINITY_DN29928_c0_g1_i1.p1 TRINITY_DN29928_c0_g1~~TRINITY_DN29928_c0_g1_i1.p1  ORF type:complete len:434 (-),score=69.14 TRINITY_DN29928_c0_g1_i1:46-1347(-)